MKAPKPTMLVDLARARILRLEPEPWLPTAEEEQAIAEGTLLVLHLGRGPPVIIDLRAAKKPDSA